MFLYLYLSVGNDKCDAIFWSEMAVDGDMNCVTSMMLIKVIPILLWDIL